MSDRRGHFLLPTGCREAERRCGKAVLQPTAALSGRSPLDPTRSGRYSPCSTPAGPLPQGMLSLGGFFFFTRGVA